jgi:hypothetical protein
MNRVNGASSFQILKLKQLRPNPFRREAATAAAAAAVYQFCFMELIM